MGYAPFADKTILGKCFFWSKNDWPWGFVGLPSTLIAGRDVVTAARGFPGLTTGSVGATNHPRLGRSIRCTSMTGVIYWSSPYQIPPVDSHSSHGSHSFVDESPPLQRAIPWCDLTARCDRPKAHRCYVSHLWAKICFTAFFQEVINDV